MSDQNFRIEWISVGTASDRFLYIFLDEAGNLDFSKSGTKYFIFGAIVKERPFHAYRKLINLKYDLIEQGVDLDRFHAAEDTQRVRDSVFDIIQGNIQGVRCDSLIVEKSKTNPSLQEDGHFYPKMLGYLLKHILDNHTLNSYKEVIVFTDRLPINKKRVAIEKAVKKTLSGMLPKSARYRILHHESKSNIDLQIADYFTWAIWRKWNRDDERSYNLIKSVIASEFDIFRTGAKHFY